MRVDFSMSPAEAARVRAFYEQHATNAFVVERARRNVDGEREALSKPHVWRALLVGLLTTQQRSGPDSAVMRFLRNRPLPVAYDACQAHADPAAYVRAALTTAGGIRRAPTIGEACAANLAWLETEGGWERVFEALRPLEVPHAPAAERAAANMLAGALHGIGPKQSRNMLQILGLTIYEVPIDSRVTKWLTAFGFPVRLSAAALADGGYYEFVSDGFQALCREAGVLPCMLDAAIFASYDEPWSKEDIVW